MGVPVRIENHSGKADRGLRVTCRNPNHTGCKKYKSCRLDLTVFGQQAPVYYLHTWLSESFNMDESTHRKWKPTRTQIREFLASQPADWLLHGCTFTVWQNYMRLQSTLAKLNGPPHTKPNNSKRIPSRICYPRIGLVPHEIRMIGCCFPKLVLPEYHLCLSCSLHVQVVAISIQCAWKCP